MAENAGDYHRGDMDVSEHVATFHGFIGLTKWGSLASAVTMLFLTLIFAAKAGFFQALLAAIVVLVVGVFLLRDKKKAAGH
jgi:hypothetical protein